MFPSPAASHDHALGIVLLCRRVWPIQFFVSAFVNYTMHSLRPQHISPLALSRSIHTRTHTHTPGALSSPPKSAPPHLPPHCPPVVAPDFWDPTTLRQFSSDFVMSPTYFLALVMLVMFVWAILVDKTDSYNLDDGNYLTLSPLQLLRQSILFMSGRSGRGGGRGGSMLQIAVGFVITPRRRGGRSKPKTRWNQKWAAGPQKSKTAQQSKRQVHKSDPNKLRWEHPQVKAQAEGGGREKQPEQK